MLPLLKIKMDYSDMTATPNKLEELKAIADAAGIDYHPNIGVDKLRQRIEEYQAAGLDDEVEPETKVKEPSTKKETTAQRHARKRREAAELVRIRVTCMNPNKSEWEGEIFTAGNSVVGTFKKYVPFNIDEGWHVPRIIYNQIRDRQCQIFYTERVQGRSIRKGKLIREFSVEVLPPLTEEELKDLAQRQAMAKAID